MLGPEHFLFFLFILLFISWTMKKAHDCDYIICYITTMLEA